MHVGHDFPSEYFMGGNKGMKLKLEDIIIEKEFRFNIINDLKSSKKVNISVSCGENNFKISFISTKPSLGRS